MEHKRGFRSLLTTHTETSKNKCIHDPCQHMYKSHMQYRRKYFTCIFFTLQLSRWHMYLMNHSYFDHRQNLTTLIRAPRQKKSGFKVWDLCYISVAIVHFNGIFPLYIPDIAGHCKCKLNSYNAPCWPRQAYLSLNAKASARKCILYTSICNKVQWKYCLDWSKLWKKWVINDITFSLEFF